MSSQRQSIDGNDVRALRALERPLVPIRTEGGDLRVHLVYPNSYWVGMSNLGFQAVYGLFGTQPGVAVERGFLPDGSEDEKIRSTPWKTFESGRLLSDCDIIGFSLSFETDYPHLLRILKNQKLLFKNAEERNAQRDSSDFPMPLIIAGGTGITLNPEPVADFIDVMVIGEAEELIPEFTAVIRSARELGRSRTELLKELSQIEGVYVPQFYKPKYMPSGAIEVFESEVGVPVRPKRRFVKDLSKFPTTTKVLTPETEFKSMYLTETGRGCEMGCRFCVAGYIYRPVRKRSEESIADSVKVGLESSNAIGFVGASVSSHKAISKLTRSVAESGGRASLSSLMSQRVTKELAASISESEYKTVALAPEAGSERLRRAAGKRVTNEQVIEAAVTLAESGIKGFKLYFIVGLPTETDEDTDAIANLAIAVRNATVEASKKIPGGGMPWVQLSVNPFIPKASTPFQWEPMIERGVLEDKIERIKKLTRKIPNLEMRFESPKESYFQALLSRGDRRVGRYLLSAEEKGKDWKWILQNKHEDLKGEVPPIDFFAKRRIPFEETLPWEVVDSLIDRKLLLREALRAHNGEDYGRTSTDKEFPVACEI